MIDLIDFKFYFKFFRRRSIIDAAMIKWKFMIVTELEYTNFVEKTPRTCRHS